MAIDDNNELLVLLLYITLLDSDDPIAYDLLRSSEFEFDRLVERNPELFRRLPFPPEYLFRRLIDRRSRRRDVGEEAYRSIMLASDSVERVGRLERSYKSLDNNTTKKLSEIKGSIAQLNAILSDAIWALSVGAKLSEVRMNRNIPVRCYLADGDVMSTVGDKLIDAIFDALLELGIKKSVDLPAEDGSWWKQVWGETKEALSQDDVVERLKKLEHAASIKLIDGPQAEVTKANADAASKMIKALEGVKSACVQIGNLLIVKYTPKKGDTRLIIRTLTASELIALEKNKAILKFPGKAMEMLDKECLGIQAQSSPHQA